ncbi:PREDICTED: longitudinals lacking protein, isoforms A/B/D/L-like [Dufourea novaeangliae]|uniref:longitudinals lacking protein, isoforms A/B/D/L-like n=1 Tax=Dufourea novaeangliae TaxID=178035 RepID=UPI0007673EFA|nr:PREDICTED: longitudinals lacking protein, isoforms A/B/D/L-like [Dufourea novaeangliae]
MAKKQMAENAATELESNENDQDIDGCAIEPFLDEKMSEKTSEKASEKTSEKMSEKTSEKKMADASGNQTALGTRDSSEYSCPRCGNAYLRLHSLNRHIKFECGVEPRFECPVCHKKSKHKHNLILHMRTHQKP